MGAEITPPRVMGVVNVTPDSFSDGGRYLGAEVAIAHARRLLAQGADILDIGGESTRPGAAPVSVDEEIGRILPVVRAIRAESDAAISIDTMKPAVMRAAAGEGATIWNDVAALGFAAEGPVVAAELGCEVMLMHMQGEPRVMQQQPSYLDVAAAKRLGDTAVSPDGKWLVAASSYDTVYMWSLVDKEEPPRVIKWDDLVYDVAIYSDSRKVVVSYKANEPSLIENAAIVLSLRTGARVRSIKTGDIASFAYSPCGRYFVCGTRHAVCLLDPILPARRALLALLASTAWYKFLVYVDGDHAVASRMLAFC